MNHYWMRKARERGGGKGRGKEERGIRGRERRGKGVRGGGKEE